MLESREEGLEPRGRSQPCKQTTARGVDGPWLLFPHTPSFCCDFCQQIPLEARWTGHPSGLFQDWFPVLGMDLGGGGRQLKMTSAGVTRKGTWWGWRWGQRNNSLNKWLLSWELKKKERGLWGEEERARVGYQLLEIFWTISALLHKVHYPDQGNGVHQETDDDR